MAEHSQEVDGGEALRSHVGEEPHPDLVVDTEGTNHCPNKVDSG